MSYSTGFKTIRVIDFFKKGYKGRANRIMAEFALFELVRRREISMSLAAEIFGLSLNDFLELLNENEIDYFTEEPQLTKQLLKSYQKIK